MSDIANVKTILSKGHELQFSCRPIIMMIKWNKAEILCLQIGMERLIMTSYVS